MAEFLSPDAGQGFICGLGWRVDCVARDAEARSGRRDENDAPATGEVGERSLREEDWAPNVGVEV
jgi:hypothetical protein